MRRNFAQILKDAKVDIKVEYQKLYGMLYDRSIQVSNTNRISVYDELSTYFIAFHFRGTCLSLDEFNDLHGFHFEKDPTNFNIDHLISLCEYIENLLIAYQCVSLSYPYEYGNMPTNLFNVQFYLQQISQVIEKIGYMQAGQNGLTIFVEKDPAANVELLSTWRTQDQALISLWNEVRTRADMITEKLVINGPYSEDIGPNVFKRECEDEVILCLNYDGKFGLNNMNNYFQAANTKGEAIPWAEWSYKVGDPILFNDSKRFDLLYNNLKGRIVDIEKHSGSISFTVDVEIPLTELMCKRDGVEFIESIENGTRIRFAVYEYDESKKGEDLDENLRLKSVVPFQLAYAVSIHKAQGLEYDSVKVIIPSNNAEKITHGIFYTAITRAKTNLKIYWSSETMHDVVKGFATDESKRKSLEIVKTKLGKN